MDLANLFYTTEKALFYLFRQKDASKLCKEGNDTILRVGEDKFIYLKKTLTSPWEQVPASNSVVAVAFMQDASILGVGEDKMLYRRVTLATPWVQVPSSIAVTSVEIMPDGSILGVAENLKLYRRATLKRGWAEVPNSCCVRAIFAK